MACISSDGTPTESGEKLLSAVKSGFVTPEDVAQETKLPLYMVRSYLRELVQTGYLNQNDEIFSITNRGTELIGE